MKKLSIIMVCALALMVSCTPDDEPQPKTDIVVGEPDTTWNEMDFTY